MAQQSHLDDLIALFKAETELRQKEEQLGGIPDWMQELHEEHQGRLQEIEALEQVVEEARAERRAADAIIEDTQETLKRYQSQINQVSTQREYGALLQEIDTAKGEIDAAEERGLEAIAQREETEAKLEQERAGFAELDQRYKDELKRWEEEKPAIAQQAEALEAGIAELRGRLPRGWLVPYDRIEGRQAGGALAAIIQIERSGKGQRFRACSACNYRVRPQAVVEIRTNGTLTYCDNCRRILYFDESEEAAG